MDPKLTIEYMEEASCKGTQDNCACLKNLQQYLIKKIQNNISNPMTEKKLTYKKNGGIAYKGCGHANQIIGITIHNIQELLTYHKLQTPEEYITKFKPLLIETVKNFREENNNDPHIQAIDEKRNKNMNRLEVKFQRGLSLEQLNTLEQKIEKNL